jgi:CDP-diacylglycerol--glycerol-3-phosphate 3-phosphatidyltransferase
VTEDDQWDAMLGIHARDAVRRVVDPVGRTLARAGVSPNVVTTIGTLGVVAGALIFYPQGEFFVGTLVITAFIFSDMIDGAVARATGKVSAWGAFLDSTLDRVGDAAIFVGLALWFADDGDHLGTVALLLYCLVIGSLVSYTKARAEGLGYTANVGIAERPERLLLVLTTTGLEGLGLPYVQAAGLWTLALASTVTLAQRMMVVRQQVRGEVETGAGHRRPPTTHRRR